MHHRCMYHTHRELSQRERNTMSQMWQLGLLPTRLDYLREFFRKRACRDLLELQVFPPKDTPKEIMECFAMRQAALSYMDVDPKDPNVIVICPGDGGAPRLAATIAFTTQWRAVSIDPALTNWLKRWDDTGPKTTTINRVHRVEVVPKTCEDHMGQVWLEPTDRVIILACHSHANLEAAVRTIKTMNKNRIDIAAMPCCVKQQLEGLEPDLEYCDDGIASPHRVIKVWQNFRIIPGTLGVPEMLVKTA